ncbi:MAG TPA: tetratricopeptide repeat protein [Gammaproteobacteria bacterium]|nr:tetratricopeptide repeat protein [Gammaproteobacteria bacterium]
MVSQRPVCPVGSHPAPRAPFRPALWRAALLIALGLGLGACASKDRPATIADLDRQKVELDAAPAAPPKVDRERVISGYRQFLSAAPDDQMYREALRRLADLELEAGQDELASGNLGADQRRQLDAAIALYKNYIANYPDRENTDTVLYQLAKAYDLKGDRQNALATLNRLMDLYPDSKLRDEIQFRRGELLFVLKRFRPASEAYADVLRFPKSPYYEKALYKRGWSLFKQNRHEEALDAFFKLLDNKLAEGKFRFDGPAINLSATEREVLNDVLRVISLSFAYLDGAPAADRFFAQRGPRPYEALIYEHLGKLLLDKERIRDAADAFLAFAKRYPEDVRAPQFHARAIAAYEKGAFASLILPAKESFVERYGVGSPFWKAQPASVRDTLRPTLQTHLRDLATHYHAVARKSKKRDDYARAAGWYRRYIQSFPNDPTAPAMNYLLAEALFDSGRISEAIPEYEKTAYGYPSHDKSAAAGYAALVGYQTLEKRASEAERAAWREKAIASALRFGSQFPTDKRVPAVLSKTAEDLLKLEDYPRALTTAEALLALPNIQKNRKLYRNGLVIRAHAFFATEQYGDAEAAYGRAIKYFNRREPEYAALRDRLAASMYKQGEAYRASGNLAAAVTQFLRVGQRVPGSDISATAEYDAAAALIQMEDWKQAQRVLENFRKRYPKAHKLQAGVTEKLALVYTKTGQKARAALEIERLAAASGDPQVRHAMMWQAANLYKETGNLNNAIRAFKRYIKAFPTKMPESMEARFQLASLYHRARKQKERFYWLRDIVKVDRANPGLRTPRTRDIAASATLQLAEPYVAAYRRVKLTLPLKKSLKKKKKLMQAAIKAYKQAMDYKVAAVATAATYQVAELYNDFASALLKSQRPRQLSAEELEQYDILLEEQAYPFEEKAIDFHVVNVRRTRDGIYDRWVEKSLAALAKLQPVRYARKEMTEDAINALH